MINSILSSIESARVKIVFIGTVPLTEPDTWKKLKKVAFDRAEESDLQITVIAECDNQLFQHSLRTDTSYYDEPIGRQTFSQLKFRRDMVRRKIENNLKDGGSISFQISTINLPLYMVMIDNQEIWYLPVTTREESLFRYKKVTEEDDWRHIVKNSFSAIIDDKKDGKFVADAGTELLEIFDQDQVPRGIFPRDCFYDTDYFQYVVWGFVFSREGELLIHQRSANAKDNQGMWDKSIGGHIDFRTERSTAQAVVRELIEELYTKEQDQQTGREFSLLSEDPDKVYYLGDWRPQEWGPDYLNHIALLEGKTKKGEEPWVYYKIPGVIARNSPRILPEGKGKRRLRVLADVYVFIANGTLTPNYVANKLKNSIFRLARPGQLKSWIENGIDDFGKEFVPTPDLEFVMTGKLRDILDEVSQFINYGNLRSVVNDSK